MTGQSYLFAGVAGYVGRPDETGEVGVFRRATDGGAWEHVLQGLETFSVHVHAGDPSVVFAGTQDGVWRSTDYGATFDEADFPDFNRQVWSFLVDSRDDNRIYAGSSPLGVYRSDDKGASWRKLPDLGVPEHCKVVFDARVMRMVQHPTRPYCDKRHHRGSQPPRSMPRRASLHPVARLSHRAHKSSAKTGQGPYPSRSCLDHPSETAPSARPKSHHPDWTD